MFGRITAGLFFLLLIWGNLVAGMHAGMACPDWPLCQGNVLPPLRLDVWMEFLHRVLAALATIFLVILARRRLLSYEGGQRTIPLAALIFIAVEIMLGGLVVIMELPVQPTTIHFMIGLAVYVLVVYMAMCDGTTRPPLFSVAGFGAPLLYITFMLYFQASLGAYLRHSAAGLACPDFPTCRGELIPSVWDGPTVINFSHRLLGVGTLATIALLFLVSLIDKRLKQRQTDLLVLVSMVTLQIIIGAATVKSGLSYPITSLHLAMTLAIVAFSMRIWLTQIAQTKEGAQ